MQGKNQEINSRIPWLSFMKERQALEAEYIEELSENYVWTDMVTGTEFFLSKGKYGDIYEKGCKKIQEYLKEKDTGKLEQFLYGENGDKGEVRFFPFLPIFSEEGDGNIEGMRICDFVQVRTAFLYALKYPDFYQSPCFQEEKEKIIVEGLTAGFLKETPKSKELKLIEDLLLHMEEAKQAKHPVDILKGGVIKIKEYYLETDRIPEIRGASLLIENAEEELIQIIKKKHIRESIIYTGGGKLLAVLPKGCGEELCEEMKQGVEKVTITAQSNFASMETSLEELTQHFSTVGKKMDGILEERQNLRWNFLFQSPVSRENITGIEDEQDYTELEENPYVVCDSCRQRIASARLNGREMNLCWSCLKKNKNGGKKAKGLALKKYEEYLGKDTVKNVSGEVKYNNIEEIAGLSQGFIGVIYGDANSMGKCIASLKNIVEMKYFSETVKEVVAKAVYESLWENLPEKDAFEIIAMGGDDIFLLVPGKNAYEIACRLGERFDSKFQDRKNDKITMSLGVCIVHDNFPVRYSFSIAQKLLKSAKQKAWEETQKSNATGTIDWMVIENDISGADVLEYQRHDIEGKPHKTLRPYTWKQAEAMKDFVLGIKDSKSFAFQMMQSWYQQTEGESELFFRYQIARMKERGKGSEKQNMALKIQKSLEKLKRDFCADSEPGLNLKTNKGKEAYTPWIDAIELWDYLGEDNGKNKSEN